MFIDISVKNHAKIFCHKEFQGYMFICENSEGVHPYLLKCCRGTCSFVRMLKGYMVRKRLGTLAQTNWRFLFNAAVHFFVQRKFVFSQVQNVRCWTCKKKNVRCSRKTTFHYKGKLQEVFRAGLNEINYNYVDSKQHFYLQYHVAATDIKALCKKQTALQALCTSSSPRFGTNSVQTLLSSPFVATYNKETLQSDALLAII